MNGATASTSVNEIEERLDELRQLQDRDELFDKVKQILEENRNLKLKIDELESNVTNDVFCIDAEPCDDAEELAKVHRYHTSGEVMVPRDEAKEKEEAEKANSKRGAGNSCWNCDGSHSLVDCQEPRDFARIAKNRKAHMEKRQSMANSARYHLDEPQKFANLNPGGLPSDKLRKALGLHDDQLPSYIYRMRELGYPPGWLREAEISQSGMALYVAQDESLPDHGHEDGEIANEDDKISYDTSKIVEWPGFNVEIPPDFRDETRHYRVPFMTADHSKEAMIKRMEPKEQKGYVRGVMQDTSTTNNEDTEVNDSVEGEQEQEEVEIPQQRELVKQAPLTESKVTSVEETTPICALYSPYQNLPENEKWATNTTDHIMFENLPDSTGKYDSMLEVLKKVRSAKKTS